MTEARLDLTADFAELWQEVQDYCNHIETKPTTQVCMCLWKHVTLQTPEGPKEGRILQAQHPMCMVHTREGLLFWFVLQGAMPSRIDDAATHEEFSAGLREFVGRMGAEYGLVTVAPERESSGSGGGDDESASDDSGGSPGLSRGSIASPVRRTFGDGTKSIDGTGAPAPDDQCSPEGADERLGNQCTEVPPSAES